MTKRGKAATVVVVSLVVTAIHVATPAGPHSWHFVHLVAQKLYFVPILLAVAWLGRAGTLGAVVLVSGLFSMHILRDWAGDVMVQADQFAELANYWAVAALARFLFERLERAKADIETAHRETLGALATSLDLREEYTAGHSERVCGYAVLLAKKLGISDPHELETIATGALLHDIGKIGIPDAILLKPGRLSDSEMAVMKKHPELGAALIGKVPFLDKARALVLRHHERFDGRGYPGGLAGAAIPLGAQIFAVADTFDALTTSRPYRRGCSYAEAREVIVHGRGTQFAPDVVTAFLSVSFEHWAEMAKRHGVELKNAGSRAAYAERK
jgi:putative nucleotidyltransferase with HDIG domain